MCILLLESWTKTLLLDTCPFSQFLLNCDLIGCLESERELQIITPVLLPLFIKFIIA